MRSAGSKRSLSPALSFSRADLDSDTWVGKGRKVGRKKRRQLACAQVTVKLCGNHVIRTRKD